MSAVNLSEVATVLTRRGLGTDAILAPVREQVSMETFSETDAMSAAALQPSTTTTGLSLGDRACLALARRPNAPTMTADQAWTGLRLDIVVELVRRDGA